jgi:hypothetical protein
MARNADHNRGPVRTRTVPSLYLCVLLTYGVPSSLFELNRIGTSGIKYVGRF